MSVKACKLPEGQKVVEKPGCQEIYIPAKVNKNSSKDRLKPISELPSWAHAAFPPPIT